MDIKISPSSGNVFTDLGFGDDEAERLRLRSTLMIQVRKLIEERKPSQSEAAQLFGVTQPRISNLVRGRIDLFSIDTLGACAPEIGWSGIFPGRRARWQCLELLSSERAGDRKM